MTEIVCVRCPHRIGLCYRDGELLRLLPCDCNDPSEVLEVVVPAQPDAALTEEERASLDERITGDWWGYYIHFEPTGVPEVDRVLSAVGLAGKMYHHTDAWNEDDADFGPIRKGESPVDFIQRAANDAAARLAARAAQPVCCDGTSQEVSSQQDRDESPAPEICGECGHLHAPEGCSGPPTPSDLWAGVSPSSCDCDFDFPAPVVSRGVAEVSRRLVLNIAEALYLRVMDATADTWTEWQYAPLGVREPYIAEADRLVRDAHPADDGADCCRERTTSGGCGCGGGS